jgi:hypothetical protein
MIDWFFRSWTRWPRPPGLEQTVKQTQARQEPVDWLLTRRHEFSQEDRWILSWVPWRTMHGNAHGPLALHTSMHSRASIEAH